MKNFEVYSLLAITIGLYISFAMVICDREELRKQAIERGHAEYVVDSDGKTTWQWKEKQNDR